MNWKNATDRYGSASISLHWLMLLLLIGVYACINLHEWAAKGSDLRQIFKTWHFMLGLSVVALVIAHLAARFMMPNPRIPSDISAWQRHSALLMHGVLYAFMLLMPILGWITLSAGGKIIPFFGLQLPPLVDADRLLSRAVRELHETIGTIGYYLIGLHAAAAMFHHYFVRDGTLLCMLPRRRTSYPFPVGSGCCGTLQQNSLCRCERSGPCQFSVALSSLCSVAFCLFPRRGRGVR